MCKPKKILLYLYILCAKRLCVCKMMQREIFLPWDEVERRPLEFYVWCVCCAMQKRGFMISLLNNLNAMRHILHYMVKGTSSQCTLDRVNCVGHFVNIVLISKALKRHVHRVDRVTACDILITGVFFTWYMRIYFLQSFYKFDTDLLYQTTTKKIY